MSSAKTGGSKRREPGCVRCQQRHVRCDRQRPTCSTCRRTRCPAPCDYRPHPRPLRFRPSRYSSVTTTDPHQHDDDHHHHPHVPSSNLSRHGSAPITPLTLSVDRGEERRSTSRHGSPPASAPPIGGAKSIPRARDEGRLPWMVETSPRPNHPDGTPAGSQWLSTPTDPDQGEESYCSPSALIVHIPRPPHSPPRPSLLTDERDCQVFAYYLDAVARWMDIGSPKRYFQSYVPSLAFTNPLVLDACMSCASHIMYRMGFIGKDAEEDYSGRVLSSLIPLLSSDDATSQNEGLLATTVILRMAEQFSDMRADYQRHLTGAASLFMDGTDWSAVEVNLATTCFWTSMRETLRIWFLREQTTDFDVGHLSLSNDDMSAPMASEEAWTNRMTYLLARVCKVCWDQDREIDLNEVAHLKNLIHAWKSHLPASFRPWCFVDRTDDHPFPIIRCLSSWHVVAWQFYYTANVMLAVYFAEEQPRTLSNMRDQMESKILSPIRCLCGLCMSSTDNIGNNLNGSHLMAWCGKLLSGKSEQSCLLHFLAEFGQVTR
ncbi:Fungal specific transcription factor domain [Teratosphaeria destructans]|uniref:Fungal specific transcription factor domain n=1 Tax=Teratosphaeria destructans TaxID=418781 RepID=A0A9W7SX45_9PEZI|nr:Fungal specific transcription factor domain [Teratosphaeria destructans]